MAQLLMVSAHLLPRRSVRGSARRQQQQALPQPGVQLLQLPSPQSLTAAAAVGRIQTTQQASTPPAVRAKQALQQQQQQQQDRHRGLEVLRPPQQQRQQQGVQLMAGLALLQH
jgi:hypothetical protein